MRYLVILLLLCFNYALADVIIDRREVAYVPCPQPPAQLIKQPDGSYQMWPSYNITTLQSCFRDVKWEEVWTDFPENGGKFIRRVGEKQIDATKQ